MFPPPKKKSVTLSTVIYHAFKTRIYSYVSLLRKNSASDSCLEIWWQEHLWSVKIKYLNAFQLGNFVIHLQYGYIYICRFVHSRFVSAFFRIFISGLIRDFSRLSNDSWSFDFFRFIFVIAFPRKLYSGKVRVTCD